MITATEEPRGTLVRVDGWLGGEGVAEFMRVMESARRPVKLLLSDLRGADAAGLSLLRRLADQGLDLDGVSPYVRLMLAGSAGSEPSSLPFVDRSETPVRREDT